MCFYISAILPRETKIKDIQPIIEKYKMGFSFIDNKSIMGQIKQGELHVRATRNYCDCDSVLGSNSTGTRKKLLMESKKVKKLKQNGWSAEQIDEWLEDKIKKTKQTKGKKWWPELQRKLANEWIQFLNELINSVSKIGLFKHWYEDNLEDETITIRETKRVNLNQDIYDTLLKMDEDIVYEFYRN
ncbi:MAG: hypothetical protein EAX96_16560 [Candidatus Lokiarchaeota archaeon]|nr:hypothetical protein [Candidatus Lokiarchaeota archaeon]